MKTNIAHFTLSLLLLFGCNSKEQGQRILALPSGKILKVKILTTIDKQREGFSGTKANQVADNEGLFFFYSQSDLKQFWMPDTYFNLNIIFLDQDLKVLYIEKNIQAHPGTQGEIPRTPLIYSRHVLEIKADSPLAEEIIVGTQFKWM